MSYLKYGLISESNFEDIAVVVCECLGYGANGNAHSLLVETSYSESNNGKTKDTSEYAGMGITQFDKLPFYDVKKRCKNKDKKKILKYFDIDLDLVEWEHLRYSPLLCAIFTRLKYKKIPAAIPITIEKRAKYWKKNYNSFKGKGTVYHYLKNNGYDMLRYDLSMEIDDDSVKRVRKSFSKMHT